VTEKALGISCRLTVALLCALLAACSTAGPDSPYLTRKAERLNTRAIKATEQERFLAAETGFAEAYRTYGMVEDHAGMVIVLVNSSRMYRSRGMTDRAAEMATRAGEMVSHVPQLAAEAWFERAKVSLLQGDTDSALNWSDKALGASRDENRAMITGLRADIHLKRGEWQKCVELAGATLKMSRSAGDRHEEADALRILADCRLAGKQPDEAAAAYEEALRLDKELALPRSIHADLKGLSASVSQKGDMRAAGEYLLRAADVAIARGDTKEAAADLNGILLLDGSRVSEIAERLQRLQEKGKEGVYHEQ